MLKDKLEIILVTYNRKQYLEDTLNQLFCDVSPIKDCSFTILDNCSTDGTSELIEEYSKKYNNIKHIRHNKNIGGNANITRAIEIATKKYFWVLCDDDKYDWTNWKEINNAIEQDNDVILTKINDVEKSTHKGLIFRQLSFLPSGIYKSNIVTESVLQNAYFNVPFLFPHLALAAEAINRNKSIYIPAQPIVSTENNTTDYCRGNASAHPYQKEIFWIVGFINAIQLIENKKLRYDIIDHLSCKRFGFFSEIAARFKLNRMYHNNSFFNICNVFCGINFRQKIQFLLALIWLDIIYFIKRFVLRNKKYIPQK